MSATAQAPEPTPRPKGKPWSVGEFAAHFHVTPKHVRFLLDTGKIDAIKIGKRKRLIPDHEARRIEREGV
jgi:hypothetical protein